MNIRTYFYGKRMLITMKVLILKKRAKRFWTPVEKLIFFESALKNDVEMIMINRFFFILTFYPS